MYIFARAIQYIPVRTKHPSPHPHRGPPSIAILWHSYIYDRLRVHIYIHISVHIRLEWIAHHSLSLSLLVLVIINDKPAAAIFFTAFSRMGKHTTLLAPGGLWVVALGVLFAVSAFRGCLSLTHTRFTFSFYEYIDSSIKHYTLRVIQINR